MEEDPPEPDPSVFQELLWCGPSLLTLAVVIVAIALFHMVLSIRVLNGRRVCLPAGFHCLLLFAGPCLAGLTIVATVPTTIPGLFVVGVDADRALWHMLRFASALAWLSIAGFTPNLLLAIVAIIRGERGELDCIQPQIDSDSRRLTDG